MNSIIFSVIFLAILGFVSGFGLAYAYKKFHVEEDPKVKEVESSLPGANCGACGFPGCRGFAEAVVAGKADPSGCLLGGKETGKIISAALGLDHQEKDPMSAFLLCGGGKTLSSNKFKYIGEENCKSANNVGGGFKGCAYGCLGFGDCKKVCPVDAITMSKENLPVVDKEKCIACGKCVLECPRNLFIILSKKINYHINCNSKDKGAIVRKVCQVGCIACSLCVKKCPVQAISMVNNVAVIDQAKCTSCGECIKVCPTKTIIKV